MSPLKRLIAPLFLICSALAFAASTYVFSSWNYEPWVLPVASNGTSVRTPFELTTAGRFRVRITVPTGSTDVNEPVSYGYSPPCLLMQLDGENANEKPSRIDSFKTAGLYVFGGMAYYESESEIGISAGEHTVTLKACQPSDGSQVFTSLIRTGEPTGRFLLSQLVRVLGWIFLVFGVGATVIQYLISNRASRYFKN